MTEQAQGKPNHRTGPSIDSITDVRKLGGPSSSLASASSILQNYLPQALQPSQSGGNQQELVHVKARREAKIADEDYRKALEKLERMRLAIEEKLEVGMNQWESWERERLNAVKTGTCDMSLSP